MLQVCSCAERSHKAVARPPPRPPPDRAPRHAALAVGAKVGRASHLLRHSSPGVQYRAWQRHRSGMADRRGLCGHALRIRELPAAAALAWPAQPPLAATCTLQGLCWPNAEQPAGNAMAAAPSARWASGSEDACKGRRSVVGRRLAVGRRRPAAITAWRPAEAGISCLRLCPQGSGLGGCGRVSSTPSCAQEERPQWQCMDPSTTLAPQPRP